MCFRLHATPYPHRSQFQAPSWLVRPMAWGDHRPPPAFAHPEAGQSTSRRRTRSRGPAEGTASAPAVHRGWEGASPSSSTSFSYGFGVKSFRPPDSGLRGRRGQRGSSCAWWRLGRCVSGASSFPMTSEDPLPVPQSEPRLTAGRLAPPVTPVRGVCKRRSHHRNHRSRGLLQKITRTSNFFPLPNGYKDVRQSPGRGDISCRCWTPLPPPRFSCTG